MCVYPPPPPIAYVTACIYIRLTMYICTWVCAFAGAGAHACATHVCPVRRRKS